MSSGRHHAKRRGETLDSRGGHRDFSGRTTARDSGSVTDSNPPKSSLSLANLALIGAAALALAVVESVAPNRADSRAAHGSSRPRRSRSTSMLERGTSHRSAYPSREQHVRQSSKQYVPYEVFTRPSQRSDERDGLRHDSWKTAPHSGRTLMEFKQTRELVPGQRIDVRDPSGYMYTWWWGRDMDDEAEDTKRWRMRDRETKEYGSKPCLGYRECSNDTNFTLYSESKSHASNPKHKTRIGTPMCPAVSPPSVSRSC